MNRWLLVSIALLRLFQPCDAGVELVGGPPRSFGERTIARTFRLDAEGPLEIEWRARILRGIVEVGNKPFVGPGEVAIDLRLPRVRARVELVHELQVKQDGKVVAAGEFPMEVFPEGLAGPAETPGPRIGVIDDAGNLSRFLEEAGWRVVRLGANLQYRLVDSGVVVVASNQPETLAEPFGGLNGFLDGGGTIIFFDQRDGRSNLFDNERRWSVALREAAAAEPVINAGHPVLLDLDPSDLSDWGGSGRVATRALAWDDWPWRRAWLASRSADADALLAEYWDGKGRAILCQCDMGERLDTDPAAQILLRNLIAFAMRVPPPPPARVVRIALRRDPSRNDGFPEIAVDPKPEELEDALAWAALAVKGDCSPSAARDLPEMLSAGNPAVIQSEFGEEAIRALNALMARMWPPARGEKPPEFASRPLAKASPFRLDYAREALWGLSAQTLSAASLCDADLNVPVPTKEMSGFQALTDPGILCQIERDKVRVVLCALPLDDPENASRQAVANQILANLADPPKKLDETNVK